MTDRVYYFDKILLTKNYLGEIQKDFNMGLTINGTKDSIKLIILNFDGVEIEPNTIIWHENTNTWWVVNHDKVDRYFSENGEYLYIHNVELLGAIDLLSARDLTDCGFNQDTYTIEQFVNRIFKLSTFELPINLVFSKSVGGVNKYNLDKDKLVDYLKTFENYTPLSALREFFDGYNAVCKMTFNTNVDGTLTSANLVVLNKTGNIYDTPIDIETFGNTRENKTIDKNSFGTTVVSNAENVISTKAKTYPTTGAVKVTGTAYEIHGNHNSSTAVIRLPSNIFRVNWVDFYSPTLVQIYNANTGSTISTTYYSFDDDSIQRAYDHVKSQLGGLSQYFEQDFPIDRMKSYGKLRFYYEDNYNPDTKLFISNNHIPLRYWGISDSAQTVLSNKEMKSNVEKADNVFYFERGKDTIEGFTFFGDTNDDIIFEQTNAGIVYQGTWEGVQYAVAIGNGYFDNVNTFNITNKLCYLKDLRFVVNYIPMSDIKIKLDNENDKHDTQLYNQNGKLTDSNTLSKLLLSYVKEIQSDEITRYKTYYNFSDIPQVGTRVTKGNDIYVINNVSMDFYQNEGGYRIDCEFTMSKNISTKSLMVNPNKNIRDYGIPQNNNVKRKQLYRDFYELNHTPNMYFSEYYLPLDKALNLNNEVKDYNEHIAVIKINLYSGYGGSNSATWYYQLDTTTYVLKKSIYEIVDFKDNNIIGYSNQNMWCGWDITRVLSTQIDMINTPVSYVDEQGQVKDIYVAFCTNEQLTSIYQDYLNNVSGGSSYEGSLSSYSVFIPKEIYEGSGNTYEGARARNDFLISETDYQKDALEVPVFEYACQVDDTDDVLIGENIFDIGTNDVQYLYCYALGDKNDVNDNNFSKLDIPTLSLNNNVYTLNNAVSFIYTTKLVNNVQRQILVATFYDSVTYDISTNTITYGNVISIDSIANWETKDLVLCKYKITGGSSPNITYIRQVSGTDASSPYTLDLGLPPNKQLIECSILLNEGYRSDIAMGSIDNISGDRVYCVIGGRTYDDTICSATIQATILRDVAPVTGYKSVNGREVDGDKTITITLASGQYLSNVYAVINPEDEQQYNAECDIISYNAYTGVINYAFYATLQNRSVRATIYYTINSPQETRTSSETINGVRTNMSYATFSLRYGEYISSATITSLSLVNNDVGGAYASIDNFTSSGHITYSLGQALQNRPVSATLTYTVSDSDRLPIIDLLMVVRNMENKDNSNANKLTLYINNYKLK